MDTEAVVFGLVRFDGDGRRVREIVVAFEDAHAAEGYARAAGWATYAVGPLRFSASVVAVDVRPVVV
ncbi:hypothetical protein [Frankia sp. CiP3]|uniref:hypothetical protein n=1 Tax=Frankia sp. CiP3 TaxID=2880971 RepID=UPI001EF596E7|nr:hypothetical protein [Frankia sp. CiP3]